MANVLYLVHRLPYPPDKGDKVRSYHVLRHLLERHRVYLGTFVDDPQDLAHVPALRELCADLHVARLQPALARLRSASALLSGQPLSLPYYADAGLARWVERTLHERSIDAALVFSSSMAQYVHGRPGLRVLLDLVDVDSAKWERFGADRAGPLGWIYRREARHLLAYEREIVHAAERSYFVTAHETALFQALAPECAGRVEPMGNGVDAGYFAPDPARPSPFAADETPVVFTGAMDYWPNVDAVHWFATEVLPALRARHPRLRLHVVGRNPSATVRALAGDAVAVTGTVPDVRPYLQHAAVAVAPLRIARGIQNKVLEAMAMGRPVVASKECLAPLLARDGVEVLAAAGAADFVGAVDRLLSDAALAARIGDAGRCLVRASFSWPAHLRRLDERLAQRAAA